MPAARAILSVFASVVMLCGTLLCACGSAGAAEPTRAASAKHDCCDGKKTPAESGHPHDGACTCHEKVTPVEAKASVPAAIPAVFLFALPAWDEAAWAVVPVTVVTEKASDSRPPGGGASLLRLGCALNL